ncbi:hypothetical protein [Craterilacuibacter sp.]|uniref:hypothetical protein n=1 Tax=Craterilacuibacter sp. TaxID=2870909 RepID=UPI003F36EE9E
MAISWLAVLKSVPWADVVSNAPVIAEGAKKLWKKTVAKTPPPVAEVVVSPVDAVPEHDQAMVQRDARLAALESTVADLQQQMLASSELITALAGQNNQLVQRIDLLRRRALWVGMVLAGSIVLLAVAVF